jgi:hypothetical protein
MSRSLLGIPGGFSPRSIPDLKLWLDATRSPKTFNGANVSKWNDLSGNGHHAVQSTATRQPGFVDKAVNNRAVLRFDGANHYMTVPDFSYAVNGLTVFAVCRVDVITEIYLTAFCHYDFGANQRSWYVTKGGQPGFGANIDVAVSKDGTFNAGSRKRYQGSTGLNISDFFIWGLVFDNGSLSLFVNGNDEVENKEVDDPVPLLHNSAGSLAIGSLLNNGVGASFMDGDIASVIFYDRALSDRERRSVEQHLKRLYGI